jgi:hypothetical protein
MAYASGYTSTSYAVNCDAGFLQWDRAIGWLPLLAACAIVLCRSFIFAKGAAKPQPPGTVTVKSNALVVNEWHGLLRSLIVSFSALASTFSVMIRRLLWGVGSHAATAPVTTVSPMPVPASPATPIATDCAVTDVSVTEHAVANKQKPRYRPPLAASELLGASDACKAGADCATTSSTNAAAALDMNASLASVGGISAPVDVPMTARAGSEQLFELAAHSNAHGASLATEQSHLALGQKFHFSQPQVAQSIGDADAHKAAAQSTGTDISIGANASNVEGISAPVDVPVTARAGSEQLFELAAHSTTHGAEQIREGSQASANDQILERNGAGKTTGGQQEDGGTVSVPVTTDPLITAASQFVDGALNTFGIVLFGNQAPTSTTQALMSHTDEQIEHLEQSTLEASGKIEKTSPPAVEKKRRTARSDLERLAAMRSRERSVSGHTWKSPSAMHSHASISKSTPVLESLRVESRERALRQAQRDAQVTKSALARQIPALRGIEPHVMLQLWDAAGGNVDAMLAELAKHSSSSTSAGKLHMSAPQTFFARLCFASMAMLCFATSLHTQLMAVLVVCLNWLACPMGPCSIHRVW